MTKEKFIPQLIGRNEQAIIDETDNWEFCIHQLNHLQKPWKEYFNEILTPKILQDLTTIKPGGISRFIQLHWIDKKPELSKLAKSNHIKIDALIAITDFLDFESLKDDLFAVKDCIGKKLGDVFNVHLKDILVKGMFVFPDKLKKQIEEKNTHYTSNNRENLVLALTGKLCFYFNILNDLGANILDRDLPRTIEGNFETRATNKKYSDLKFRGLGEDKHQIPNLFPTYSMFLRESNSFLSLFENLTDQEVENLIETIG
ncbi:MAG: hypothetical protein HQ541_20725 [Mariniphaga sp.]|nr:hypothetical protein [Mariniphaga sp.]